MVAKSILKFIRKNWLIIIIWAIGFFLRCYRQTALLGFYYDQGRDAKMAADIISFKNFPAIGPTTGINGLYLGPFWFYLITPGYFIGGGDPAIASYFIAFLESLTIPLLFFFIKKYWRSDTAYIAAFLWTFSHYLIRSSRWFSNPSPIPTFVLLSLWLLLLIVKDKKIKYLPILSLVIGLSLQLEAASAVFFIPVILIFFWLHRDFIFKIKPIVWLKSIIYFLILLLPQLAFELKNNFLISRNFIGFLTGRVNSDTGRSWSVPDFDFVIKRLNTYYGAFFSKLDTNLTFWSLILLVIFIFGLIFLILRYRHHIFIKLNLLWFLVPLAILLFFSGNYGQLYDYYLTGYFPVFIILFAVIITSARKFLYYVIAGISMLIFINGNFIHLKNYLIANPDGPTHITLGNELSAVDLVCKYNQKNPGNFDVYVPPVIAHSYEYLISWRQRQNLCPQFDPQPNDIVYVIYEVDPPHPDRLRNWLLKYPENSLLTKDSLGGVTVASYNRKSR